MRCAPRWQSLAFRHRHSPNTAVAGMAEVVAAVLTEAAVEASTAEAVAGGSTVAAVVVLPGVPAERHRVRFQGRELVGIAPTARGRTV